MKENEVEHMKQEKERPLSERIKDPQLPVIRAMATEKPIETARTESSFPPDGAKMLLQDQRLEQM